MATRPDGVAETQRLQDPQPVLEDGESVAARPQCFASLMEPDRPALAGKLDACDETGDAAADDFRGGHQCGLSSAACQIRGSAPDAPATGSNTGTGTRRERSTMRAYSSTYPKRKSWMAWPIGNAPVRRRSSVIDSPKCPTPAGI